MQPTLLVRLPHNPPDPALPYRRAPPYRALTVGHARVSPCTPPPLSRRLLAAAPFRERHAHTPLPGTKSLAPSAASEIREIHAASEIRCVRCASACGGWVRGLGLRAQDACESGCEIERRCLGAWRARERTSERANACDSPPRPARPMVLTLRWHASNVRFAAA